jgi:hypothetical protein
MILFCQCASNKFNKIVEDGLEASIDLERDTFLLGEPFFATFTIYNKSKVDFEIDLSKGLFDGGKDDNYNIKIIHNYQDTLKLDISFGINVRDDFGRFPANSSKNYKLFIPSWLKITENGKYQIIASKNAKISPYSHGKRDIFSKIITNVTTKEADVAFTIIEDSLKLGEYINNLTKEIGVETKGRIVTYLGIEVGEEDYIPISENLAENMKNLFYINDKRIIPFLARSYKYNMNLPRHEIIYLLSRYPNDSTVFNIMKLAANDVCTVNEEVLKYYGYSYDEIRQSAIRIIMTRNTDEVLQYVISKDNKDCPFERYLILHDARSAFDKERLIKLCEAYINDENIYVKEKAIEILNEIKSE